MDALQRAAMVYQDICRHRHTFEFDNGKSFTLVCKPGNFAHLAGLRKLSDIYSFAKENTSAIMLYRKILHGEITLADAQASVFYDFSAAERIESICRIEELFHTDRAVYGFNRRLAASRIRSDILFFKLNDNAYLLLGAASNDGTYFPETFFLCYDDLYIRGQTVVRINSYVKTPVSFRSAK